MIQDERGILPCTNCIITVPQDKVYTVESFGSFFGLREPGLSFTGVDLCGICIALKSISTRIEQYMVEVPTKTKDNTFVKVQVAVQMGINKDNAENAIYKLDNLSEQLESYVSNIVRAAIPALTLDEAFEKKEEMSSQIQEVLGPQMLEFGFSVHKALVVDLRVNADVVRAMNEVNRQKRLQEAGVMAAEAEKIRTVRAAEASADAADLQGQGIAKQRAAIIEGLRQSLTNGHEEDLSTEDITTLLLTTQYFETLKDIGTKSTCKTYFLPREDEGDLDAQIRSGLLQGQVGLESMLAGGAGGGQTRQQQPRHQPQQQTMQDAPPRRNRRQQSPASHPRQSYTPPPAAAPTPPPAPRAPVTMQIQIPAGVGPGQVLQVQAPDGRVLQVQVPQGAAPGSMIQIQA